MAPPRNVVRHPRHRRGLPYGQSAAVSRPDRLDHQPRRGPRSLLRHHLRAAARKDRRQAAADRALRRADRPRAHAEDHAQERVAYEDWIANGRRRTSPGDSSTRIPPPACATPRAPREIRRACSTRTAPTCCTRSWRCCRIQGHLGTRHGHAGGADVPRQRLVARLLRAHGRRHAGDAGRQAGRRLDLRAAQHLQSQFHRGGADGVADAAAGSGEDRQQAASSQARGDRRLGLPARHDQDLPGRLRRRGGACLGHDRDEPARLALHDQAGICGADRRGAARHAAEAGPSALRRRDEDHRRQRQGTAVGRQDLRAA